MPSLLFMDEPTSGLDATAAVDIIEVGSTGCKACRPCCPKLPSPSLFHCSFLHAAVAVPAPACLVMRASIPDARSMRAWEACACSEPLLCPTACARPVMQALKRMAYLGMNVITVIHQPRYSIFTLFDDVMLLGKGGR